METLRLPEEILGLYHRQKLELHFRDKSDSEFMKFLLDTAVRVISIVQHLAPVIEAVSGENEIGYEGDGTNNMDAKDKSSKIHIKGEAGNKNTLPGQHHPGAAGQPHYNHAQPHLNQSLTAHLAPGGVPAATTSQQNLVGLGSTVVGTPQPSNLTISHHPGSSQFSSYSRALQSTLPGSAAITQPYLATHPQLTAPDGIPVGGGAGAVGNQNFSPNKLSRIWKALSGDDNVVTSLLPPQIIPSTSAVQMDSSGGAGGISSNVSIRDDIIANNTQLRGLSDVTMAAPTAATTLSSEFEQSRGSAGGGGASGGGASGTVVSGGSGGGSTTTTDGTGTKKLCQYCNKLITKTYLNLHIRTVHLRIRPYPCPYCQATFTQSASKNYHVQHVHKEMQ